MLEEEREKAKFNVMELEVSISTLEAENQQLKTEIADMSVRYYLSLQIVIFIIIISRLYI